MTNSPRIDVPKRKTGAARATIGFHIPSSIRLNVLDGSTEQYYFAAVKNVFAAPKGVEWVHANASASSLVIDYNLTDAEFPFRLQDDPDVTNWPCLVRDDARLTEIDKILTNSSHSMRRHPRLSEGLVVSAQKLDSGLNRLSRGYLYLMLLMPSVFSAITSTRRAHILDTSMLLSRGSIGFNSSIYGDDSFTLQLPIVLSDVLEEGTSDLRLIGSCFKFAFKIEFCRVEPRSICELNLICRNCWQGPKTSHKLFQRKSKFASQVNIVHGRGRCMPMESWLSVGHPGTPVLPN